MTDDQEQSPTAPTEAAPTEAVPTEAVPTEAGPIEAGPTDAEPTPAAPAPVLVAEGLGARGQSGWLFQGVSLSIQPASLAAIVGPAGSGRSSLLLALAGRMQPAAGTVSVLGHSLADDAAAVRGLTSVARAAGVIGPEPALTVGESIGERCLVDDVPEPEGRERFERACRALQYSPDLAATVESVVGVQGALLAAALAYVRTSAVIMLDDVDRDIAVAGRADLIRALRRLTDTGVAMVVTAVDRTAVTQADPVVELVLPAGRADWSFDPTQPTAPTATAGDSK